MRTSEVRVALVTVGLLVAGAEQAAGQWGPLFDWINKLTGPGFVRAGAQLELTDQILGPRGDGRIWLAGMGGWKVSARDGSDADGIGIQMWSVQATLDAPFLDFTGDGRVELRGVFGVAGHLFTASDFDNFITFSLPALATLRIQLGRGSTALRFGTGFNIFWFPDDAFEPLSIPVQTDGFEGAWTNSVALEIGG